MPSRLPRASSRRRRQQRRDEEEKKDANDNDPGLTRLEPELASSIDEIWPLQLVNLKDDDQMGILFQLLRSLPHVVQRYLDTCIFPETCAHQGLKLSACGQELGGDLLFRRRSRFCGNPSDLLPDELGRCHYESGTDGKMCTCTDGAAVMSVELLGDDWSVASLLLHVARCGRYEALIDTGKTCDTFQRFF